MAFQSFNKWGTIPSCQACWKHAPRSRYVGNVPHGRSATVIPTAVLIGSIAMSDSMSRRRFLGSAVVGGVAAGIAARSWAAEDAPGRKIVVGVMGMGGRGTELALQFQGQPGCEVAYVCCVDKNRLAAAAKAVTEASGSEPKAVGDFRRILDDQAVDVLVCAAPDHWHAPATILACAAGKHVYVEKPCCHNPREGEMQVAAARKNTTHRPGGHPAPQLPGHHRGDAASCATARSARCSSPAAGTTTASLDRPRPGSARARMSRLRTVAGPGAAAALSQQPGALQLALVLALGHRRDRQQRRACARLVPLGPGRRLSDPGHSSAADTTVSTTTRKRPTRTSSPTTSATG